MATWNGDPKIFPLERYLPENYGHGEFIDVEFRWSYSTSSDTLVISQKSMAGNEQHFSGHDDAVAQLYMLADWYGKYEGTDKLRQLLAPMLER